MKPLQPKAGEIAFREWEDTEGARHVLLVAALRPHPYSNILTRFSEKRKSYGQWQNDMKVRLTLAVPKSYKPLEGSLSVAIGAGMKPFIPPGGTRSVNIYRVDATNLQKAIEDACNGILWRDDKQNRQIGTVATDASVDWFSVSAWGQRPDGSLRLVPLIGWGEAEMGPTRADWLKEDSDAQKA